MYRKILLLNGSPRAKGNTEMLSDAFIEGVKEAGHEVKKFNLRTMNIKPCIGSAGKTRVSSWPMVPIWSETLPVTQPLPRPNNWALRFKTK